MTSLSNFSSRIFAAVSSVTISAVFLAAAIVPATQNITVSGVLV